MKNTKYACLRQSKKSAVAKHSITTGHYFCFSGTSILHRTLEYADQLVKALVEICRNMNSVNRDDGLILSQAYKQHVNEHKSRTNQSKYMTPPTNAIVSAPAVIGRYIMTWTDLRHSMFSYDKDRDGPQIVGLLTIQPPNVAVTPRYSRFQI